MKKLLFTLILILGIAFNAQAQMGCGSAVSSGIDGEGCTHYMDDCGGTWIDCSQAELTTPPPENGGGTGQVNCTSGHWGWSWVYGIIPILTWFPGTCL